MRIALAFALTVLSHPSATGRPTASVASANAHPTYTSLRGVTLGGEGHQVKDFAFRKDAATFTLTGAVYPLAPVDGRVTGAVFVGSGTMAYEPPVAAERGMLRAPTKGEAFNETFERAVFRFTDDTAALIAAASTGAAVCRAGSRAAGRIRTTPASRTTPPTR